MGWTVTLDAAGDDPALLEPALDEFVDLLADRGGAVSAAQVADRYGATFSIYEDVPTAAAAIALGLDVFIGLAEKSGLPAWPVVRAEALTFEEQDRDLETPNFPELVGVSEIAQLINVTRQRASALAQSPEFPSPVATLASGPVWTRPSLNRFVEEWPRKSGRPPKLATLARKLLQEIDPGEVELTPQTRAILDTPDDEIADHPFSVLVLLAQALDRDLATMRTTGEPEPEIAIVQRWFNATVSTMSGYSATSK